MSTHKFAFNSTFSLLNVDYVQLNKSWNYKHIISPFYRLYLINEGHGTLSNTTQNVTLEGHFLYLIPSFTQCSYYCPSDLSQYYLHILESTSDEVSLFVGNRKIFKVPATSDDFRHFKRLITLNPERGLFKSTDPKEYENGPSFRNFRNSTTVYRCRLTSKRRALSCNYSPVLSVPKTFVPIPKPRSLIKSRKRYAIFNKTFKPT